MEYFNSCTDETPVEEMIETLSDLCNQLRNQGAACPLLSDLVLHFAQYFQNLGMQINQDAIREIYEKALESEKESADTIHPVKHKHKHKHKHKKRSGEARVSGGFAKGFCKFLGGALCCIIPHPLAWGIGTSLVALGVQDMVKHADDAPEISEIEEKVAEHSIRVQNILKSIEEDEMYLGLCRR
jgi:hypothetical protein